MLVLSRKVGEELVIGDNVRVVINHIAGNRVTVGIVAPNDVHIVRGELNAILDEFKEERARTIPMSHAASNRPTAILASSCSR